jgi:hypothetical protein
MNQKVPKFVQGKIPSRVAVFVSRSTEVQRETPSGSQVVTASSAFLCDADSPDHVKTAGDWARRRSRDWHTPVEPTVRDNSPMSGLAIWDLVVRSEGGRAYKVVTQDGLLLDMREDVLLESIISTGIAPGGVLPGEYVIATRGSQNRLVRVGSAQHVALLGATARAASRSVKSSELQVGGVYIGTAAEPELFLGFVRDADGKRKQLWVDVKNHCLGQSLNDYQVAFDRRVCQMCSEPYKGAGHPMGLRGTLRASSVFLERVGTVEVGDRSRFFYVRDIQDYSAYEAARARYHEARAANMRSMFWPRPALNEPQRPSRIMERVKYDWID